jgi:hypothetical protein
MGISVSFWLNNWNDNNKYKKVRNEFIISLKQELMLDTIQLSRKIAELTTVNHAVTKGITLTDKVHHTEIKKKEFQRVDMLTLPALKVKNKTLILTYETSA